jgi:hypothetical protein
MKPALVSMLVLLNLDAAKISNPKLYQAKRHAQPYSLF